MRLWLRRPRPSGRGSASSVDWLLVGLGNPGRRYEGTRHNLGRQAVEAFARRHAIDMDELRHGCRFGLGTVAGHRVCLAAPTGYMNESGRCVASLARFFKVPPQHVLLFYDDLDLPLGALRVRASGGSGGHNGVSSTLASLGSTEVARVRIGIGRPPPAWDPADYVLARFDSTERPVADDAADRAAQAADTVIAQGIEAGMNAHN